MIHPDPHMEQAHMDAPYPFVEAAVLIGLEDQLEIRPVTCFPLCAL